MTTVIVTRYGMQARQIQEIGEVEAIHIKQSIMGRRWDTIIMACRPETPDEWRWYEEDLPTRLPPDGKIILIGGN